MCCVLFVVLFVVRVGGVVVGLDTPPPDTPPPDTTPPDTTPPDRPKCRSFFFPSPAPIFVLFVSHCVSSS